MNMSPYEKFKINLTDFNSNDETNYLIPLLSSQIEKFSKFGENDIRKVYFELLKDVISVFSMHRKNFWLRTFIDLENSEGLEFLKSQPSEYFKDKFDNLQFSWRSINTNVIRSLILESWSLFEYSITIIYEEIFSEDERFKFANRHTKDFKRILKKHFEALGDHVIEEAVSELNSKVDSFLPIINKVNKIFKRAGTKYDQSKEDLKFLTFFGRLRNGIHHNFIYKGPSKPPYNLNGNIYQFEDGKVIVEKFNEAFDEMELINALIIVVSRYFDYLDLKNPIEAFVPRLKV